MAIISLLRERDFRDSIGKETQTRFKWTSLQSPSRISTRPIVSIKAPAMQRSSEEMAQSQGSEPDILRPDYHSDYAAKKLLEAWERH